MKNDAYLAYYKDAMDGNYIKTGHVIAVRQYWETPDNIMVYGDTTRTITVNDGLYNNIGYSDEKVEIKYRTGE